MADPMTSLMTDTMNIPLTDPRTKREWNRCDVMAVFLHSMFLINDHYMGGKPANLSTEFSFQRRMGLGFPSLCIGNPKYDSQYFKYLNIEYWSIYL